MAEPMFSSALGRREAPQGLSVAVSEVVDRGMIDLRGDANDPPFRSAVESVLGVSLPLKPRTSSPSPNPSPQGGEEQESSSSPSTGEGRGGGGPQARSSLPPGGGGSGWGGLQPRTVLWLSPDQWLILTPRQETARLLADLRARLAGIHALAVDVSDARTILRLEGEGVREVLMKGVPVDLLDPAYGAGAVRRVRFAEIAALIHVAADAPDVIDLYVFRSYADYAWDWLLATARAPAKLKLFGPQPAPAV